MSVYLRQSTNSQVIEMGPFISSTDFITAQTGLTILNTDVKLIQAGSSTNKNSGGGTHVVNGLYSFTFNSTDSATVGRMKISIAVSGSLAVWLDVHVLEEAVYDMLFAAGAIGHVDGATVDLRKINNTSIAGTGTRVADAFVAMLNIATPAFTVASVNQTGDAYAKVNDGTFGNAALNTDLDAIIATLAAHVLAFGTTDSNVTAILADTNELQTDWVNGGRLDLLVDAIIALDTAIKAKTDQMVFTVANKLDSNATHFAGTAYATALTAEIAALLATVLTESYAADGAAFTLPQALYEICQGLTEFAISSTTKTVKKRDGSTTAYTETLNSATAPTSITRAT